MREFYTDVTNLVDRVHKSMQRRVRPASLDASFECHPDLVAITCELYLRGASTLVPTAGLKAWGRTEKNRIKQMQPSEMSTEMTSCLLNLMSDSRWTDTPQDYHADNFTDSEETLSYEICFMRDVTIIGWAEPQDGMSSIEGEDMDLSYPRPADFLGCVYSQAPQSNHRALAQSDRIKRDIHLHHKLIKHLTGVSFELREIVDE